MYLLAHMLTDASCVQEKEERQQEQGLIQAFRAGLEVWTGRSDSGPEDLTAALDATSKLLDLHLESPGGGDLGTRHTALQASLGASLSRKLTE